MSQAERSLLNRDCLAAELGVLRAVLRGEDPAAARADAGRVRDALPGPSSVDEIAAAFGLDDFERSILVLAAGPELVTQAGAELLERTGTPLLTFGTALAVLPGAHWRALTPEGPLRRWALVTLQDPWSPTNSPLRVDERVLHHLVGAGGPDGRVAHLMATAAPYAAEGVDPNEALSDVHRRVAASLARQWASGSVVVETERADDARPVLAGAAHRLGRLAVIVAGSDLPNDPADLAAVLMLLRREALLEQVAIAIVLDPAGTDAATRVMRAAAQAFPGVTVGPGIALVVREEPADTWCEPITAATIRIPRLDLRGRVELLTRAVAGADGTGVPEEMIRRVAGVFDLSVEQARRAAHAVGQGSTLWEAARRSTRVRPGALARRLKPRAGWADLVLPPAQVAQLQALVAAVRQRSLVLDDWGFAHRSTRGLGTLVLFAGASGTGKTLAAEVVAHELGLDLLHVDLSQAVSKYIGETEKNLGAVFDAAEAGSAVLLFDEADTLFGKRTEVRDSHDRYANLEVGYLLQRTEEFRGLAVLTTNARSAVDQAFLRRLHAVVTFPYPDVGARARLWELAFPPGTPLDIDVRGLAQTDVPGGAIFAAALVAAYLAADDSGVVTTEHVREALGWELAKTGRGVSGAVIGRSGRERS